MKTIVVKLKDDTDKRFEEKGRVGGSYTVMATYLPGWIVIEDEYGKRTALSFRSRLGSRRDAREGVMTKPPLGVMPLNLWLQSVKGDPTLTDLLERYLAVSQAIDRYLAAGLPVNEGWLMELGTHPRVRGFGQPVVLFAL